MPRQLVVVVALGVVAPATARAAPVDAVGAPGCLMMAGAGHAACGPPAVAPALRSSGAAPASAASGARTARAEPIGFVDFAAVYSLYRLVSANDPHRGCRLQPTCSLFAAQAARRLGFWRGLLMGLTRAQMAHTDQDGFLPRALASDGQFIFLDPVERWLQRAP